MRLNQSPVASDLFSHASCVMKPPQKSPKDKFQRLSRLVNMWRFGESGTLGEGMEAPYIALCICSIWLFLSYVLL